jgi:hypothetical protein
MGSDERLKPLLTALRSRKAEERLQALDDLGGLGSAGRPAAAVVCEILVSDPTPALRQSALATLEKIHPELHKPVVVLLVEAAAAKHETAAAEIGRLAEDGRGAVPILLTHIRNAPSKFPEQAPQIIAADVAALAQVAPEDLAAQKMLIEVTRLTLFHPIYRRSEIGGPARAAAVRALGDLVRRHPEQGKNIAPPLLTATRTTTDPEVRGAAVAVLGDMAESDADLRPQIAAGLALLLRAGETAAIAQLAKCGRDARDALPLLKQLKLHPNESVRVAAADAVMRIEDAVAGNAMPPRKPDPAAPTADPAVPRPAVPSAADDSQLPTALRPLVARLRSGTAEERAQAADELAAMGEKAAPAARALCEAALNPSQKVSRAALQALEKVQPELHQSVFVLLVDEKAANHQQALTKLGLLAEQGAPAVPVLLHRIKVCQEQLTAARSNWERPTLQTIIGLLMRTVAKVGPEEPQVLRAVIDLTRFTSDQAFRVETEKSVRLTKTPFREEGVQLLGELGEGQPAQRKQIIPTLTGLLKESVQQTNADHEGPVLIAAQDVSLTTDALLRCGPEAKEVLTKEALPRLKELQFHRSDAVRKAAEAARRKIEDAQ